MIFVDLIIVSEVGGLMFFDIENDLVLVKISLFGGYVFFYIFKSDN